MATMGDRRVFVDTNVLVYSTVAESPFFAQAAAAIARLSENGYELWISRQILREFYAVLTLPRTFPKPISGYEAAAIARNTIDDFAVAEDDAAVTGRLLELVARFDVRGRLVHDANIVATMLVNGITRLFTYNTRDFGRYASVVSLVDIVA